MNDKLQRALENADSQQRVAIKAMEGVVDLRNAVIDEIERLRTLHCTRREAFEIIGDNFTIKTYQRVIDWIDAAEAEKASAA